MNVHENQNAMRIFWYADGVLVYQGPIRDNRLHAHNAIQIVFAPKETVRLLDAAGLFKRTSALNATFSMPIRAQENSMNQTTTINTEELLRETRMLNFTHPQLTQLQMERGWSSMNTYSRIESIYNFVRDEIFFGYNRRDDIPASEVLKDGYGQCNTKATLLMALLRQNGIPCRLHGFTIHRNLQKGAIDGLWYRH